MSYLGGFSFSFRTAANWALEVDTLYANRKSGYSTAATFGASTILLGGTRNLPQIYVPVVFAYSVSPIFRLKFGGFLAQGVGNVSESSPETHVLGATIDAVSASKGYGATPERFGNSRQRLRRGGRRRH